MINFTQRQINTLVDALHCYHHYMNGLQSDLEHAYITGVCDALNISFIQDNNYTERFYIYPTEVKTCYDNNSNSKIYILIVDALLKKVKWDIRNDTDEFIVRNYKKLKSAITKFYKTKYNEKITIIKGE